MGSSSRSFSHYTNSIQMCLSHYVGRWGEKGWGGVCGIFHSILSYWIQINKPAGKHLPSNPAWCLSQSCPRCRWCRTSDTLVREADHPKACLRSQSHGEYFLSLSGSHYSSGIPHYRRTSSPLKKSKMCTAQPATPFAEPPPPPATGEISFPGQSRTPSPTHLMQTGKDDIAQ